MWKRFKMRRKYGCPKRVWKQIIKLNMSARFTTKQGFVRGMFIDSSGGVMIPILEADTHGNVNGLPFAPHISIITNQN